MNHIKRLLNTAIPRAIITKSQNCLKCCIILDSPTRRLQSKYKIGDHCSDIDMQDRTLQQQASLWHQHCSISDTFHDTNTGFLSTRLMVSYSILS